MAMIDLDRVARYVELGFDKEDAVKRVEKETKEEMKKILRHSSLERSTFEEKPGLAEWSLTISIPFELIGLDGKKLPEKILANFYKCGDGTQNVHYVSWNAIEVAKPDFHRPDYFGEIYF